MSKRSHSGTDTERCGGRHCRECRAGKHRGTPEPRRPVDGIEQINNLCTGLHCVGRHFAVEHRTGVIPNHTAAGRRYTGPPIYPWQFAKKRPSGSRR